MSIVLKLKNQLPAVSWCLISQSLQNLADLVDQTPGEAKHRTLDRLAEHVGAFCHRSGARSARSTARCAQARSVALGCTAWPLCLPRFPVGAR